MNKYDLFRAFQDVDPGLMEEAERLTVHSPEYQTEKTPDAPKLHRRHEEDFMGKHGKTFRTMTGIAAAVAICSIGVAGYFAIHPKVAEQPDSGASAVAEVTDITEQTALSHAESTVTATQTVTSPLSEDFEEETAPPQNDTEESSVDWSELDQTFADNSFAYGAGFVKSSDLTETIVKPVDAENGKKMSLNLSIMYEMGGTDTAMQIPATVVLMQDGEIIPFALAENGKTETSQTVEIEIPENKYTNVLTLILMDSLSDRSIEKTIGLVSEVDGVIVIKQREVSEPDWTQKYLDVTLTSDLLTNDKDLYAEIYDKLSAISGIQTVKRNTEHEVWDTNTATLQKIWFTPHCRTNYSTLTAAVTYHKSPARFPGIGPTTASTQVQLYCEKPDESTDSSAAYYTASADDYIEYPEAVRGANIGGSTGIAIGKCQNYSYDAGANKYQINNSSWSQALPLNRNELYLKAHFDEKNNIMGDVYPKNYYALVLCDGKPVGLANGKDAVLFEARNESTLNLKLTLDDSIADGQHSFSVFIADASAQPRAEGEEFKYYPYDSSVFDIQS